MAEHSEVVASVDGLQELAAERERRDGGRLQRYFVDCRKSCAVPNPRRRKDKAWLKKELHLERDGSQRYCRVLYQKHLTHMAAGAQHRERSFMAGNRVGKSDCGGVESTFHLTGIYPHWWEGKRFDEPIRLWACGDNAETVREITQEKLLGPIGFFGAGFLPWASIHHHRVRRGAADAVEKVWVRHASGGKSVCHFKSYEQKRKSFQGTAQHVIWLDEECPMDIYAECLLRTARTSDFPGGIIYATFTPLLGMTELIKTFLPEGQLPPGGVVEDTVA